MGLNFAREDGIAVALADKNLMLPVVEEVGFEERRLSGMSHIEETEY